MRWGGEAEGMSHDEVLAGTALQLLGSAVLAWRLPYSNYLSTSPDMYTIHTIQIFTNEFRLTLGQNLRAHKATKAPGAGCHCSRHTHGAFVKYRGSTARVEIALPASKYHHR